MDLRANTAVDVLIGPFIDKTDGNTTEDSLTLTAAEIKLSKNGQALTLKSDVTAAAFDDDGYYNCELDATDTNTEGQLILIVHQAANALPVRHEYNVMAEAAWDSLYVAKDAGFMDVNIKTVGRADTQETEADNLESACSNYSATRGLTGTAVPAVAADGAFGLPISDAGGLDLDAILADTNELQGDWTNTGRLDTILDSILADTGELQTDWVDGGRLDLLIDAILLDTGTTLDGKLDTITTDVAAILIDTMTTLQAELDGIQADTEDIQTQIGTAGAGLTDLGGMSTGMKAEVNVEVDGALDTTIPELAVATPATTPTLRTGVMLVYMKFRNQFKTQTSGTDALELYNDAGTKITSKLITDDGSDYVEAKMT